MPQKDFLTGLLSKESMEFALDKLKAECDIDKSHFSVLVLDLDHFKTYNDKYGHLFGDDILKYFAGTLRIGLESLHTFIFRFGGDEFIIVFPSKNAKEVYNITHDIFKIMKRRLFLSQGRMYKVSFSAGIAVYPTDARKNDDIIHKADKAMYYSKTHGRGRVTIYSHIFRKTVAMILSIIAVILLAAGALYHFNKSSYKDEFIYWLQQKTGKTEGVFLRRIAKIDTEGLDAVYLKSGRVIRGTIVRDGKDKIELSLSLETGTAGIAVNRSDIAKVERRQIKSKK